jgi:simple sugar transport system ATP-binding protein
MDDVTSGQRAVVEVSGVVKRYGAVRALRGVSLSVYPGEIVGLVGDNGAGKSTLVKILSGVLQPDAGRIFLDGREAIMRSPYEARRFGIETIYQDLALAPNLSIASNVFLGKEVKRGGWLRFAGLLDRRRMDREAQTVLTRLKINVGSVRYLCENLSGGQRQAVAVARALAWGSRVILMDEPTAALGVEQQEQVGHIARNAREHGIPVLFISHNLPQVHDLCDRVVVLFQGSVVANLRCAEVSIDEIVMWITGAALRISGSAPQGT